MQQIDGKTIQPDPTADQKGGEIVLSSEESLQLARETYDLIPVGDRYPELFQELQALAEGGEYETLLEVQNLYLVQVTDNRVDNSTHTTTLNYQPFTFIDNSQHTNIFITDSSTHNSHNRKHHTSTQTTGGSGDEDLILKVSIALFTAVFITALYSYWADRPMRSPRPIQQYQQF